MRKQLVIDWNTNNATKKEHCVSIMSWSFNVLAFHLLELQRKLPTNVWSVMAMVGFWVPGTASQPANPPSPPSMQPPWSHWGSHFGWHLLCTRDSSWGSKLLWTSRVRQKGPSCTLALLGPKPEIKPALESSFQCVCFKAEAQGQRVCSGVCLKAPIQHQTSLKKGLQRTGLEKLRCCEFKKHHHWPK